MRNFIKYLCILGLVSILNTGLGQDNTKKLTIHFITGKTAVEQNRVQLDELIATLKNYDSVTVAVEGNTDNTGKNKINKKLSTIRANAVKTYLVQNGVKENIITVKALSSKNPVATNKTKKGRSLNRRVDIIVKGFTKPQKEEPIFAKPVVKQIESIQELYKQLAKPLQSFCINPNRDTVLTCAKGTIIYIKGNSIATNAYTGSCIQFNVKEDFLKSDMVLDNLSTTSNGEMLESQGMIYTEALDSRGNKLELVKGKDMVIMLPTDSINDNAKIFDGHRQHDSVMNWQANNGVVLNNVNARQLNYCDSIRCMLNCMGSYDCPTCKFFFCRIGRLDNVIGGLFNNSVAERNYKFKNCEKLKDSLQKLLNTTRLNNPFQNNYIDGINITSCEQLDKMFKQYGVKNYNDLVKAINKKLLDSFKVTNLADLEIALRNAQRSILDSNYKSGKIGLEDFKYYVFNNTSFGWVNCDRFVSLNRNRLINMTVNLERKANIDCKLIFKKRRIALPCYTQTGLCDFKNIPKDEDCWLVCLKIENEIPYLSLQEITTASKTFEVDFKQYTLEELKQELKKLD